MVNWLLYPLACLLCSGLILSCVPQDPKGSSGRAEEEAQESPPLSRFRPRPHARPALRTGFGEQPFDADTASPALDPPLTDTFRDDFEREELGTDWLKTSQQWHIDNGRLCAQYARNHPVWLSRRLPTNARISFAAISDSDDGDLKVEAWGSGRSFAHSASYSDATSYLFVYGGWRNQLHVLARLNEHGSDRLALRIQADAKTRQYAAVERGRVYRFVIERKDGKVVTWHVGDELLFRFDDQSPLKGPLHDHFGFNDWETKVCFDDLVITPLAE